MGTVCINNVWSVCSVLLVALAGPQSRGVSQSRPCPDVPIPRTRQGWGTPAASRGAAPASPTMGTWVLGAAHKPRPVAGGGGPAWPPGAESPPDCSGQPNRSLTGHVCIPQSRAPCPAPRRAASVQPAPSPLPTDLLHACARLARACASLTPWSLRCAAARCVPA